MNGLSLNELCCLFCCPPFPSHIVAKLAFLPPSATYKLIVNDSNEHTNPIPPVPQKNNGASGAQENSALHNYAYNLYNSIMCAKRTRNKTQKKLVYTNTQLQLTEKAEWQYSPTDLDKLETFLCKTDRGHKIACLYVKCTPNPKYTILFSHGNAVDLGQMSSFYYGLGMRLECNVFTYDYSGYGASDSQPTEQNLYADIEAAWNALRSRYGISPSNIVLYGQSIGTVPTVDLASKYDCAGVILHAPLMSGMRVAFNTKRTWCCDAFPSIDKASSISSLVLIIHGTDDEVIDVSHGRAIYSKCQRAAEPLWVEGAGHNDVEIYSQYMDRLKRFINFEVSKHQSQMITTMEPVSLKAAESKNQSEQQLLTPDSVAIGFHPKEDVGVSTSVVSASHSHKVESE